MVYDALSTAIRSAVAKAHPVPIKRLVAFERTRLAKGGTATVQFTIPSEALSITTADGSRKLYAGVHNLVFSRGDAADDVTLPVTLPVTVPVTVTVESA